MWALAEGSWQAGRQQLQAVLHPAPSRSKGDNDDNEEDDDDEDDDDVLV